MKFSEVFVENVNKSNIENHAPKTISQINIFLKKNGISERLARGKGYFYFYGGDADKWKTSSVMVYNIDELSFDQWLQTVYNFKLEYEKR